jgi:protein SCO1/2
MKWESDPAGLCRLAASLVCSSVLSLASAHAQAQERAAVEMTDSARFSSAVITVPDVQLIRADGKELSLRAALDDGRPLVLNFIYTSCTSICPLLSQVVADFRARLGEERSQVHVVSISIDPEQDTPKILRNYARQFQVDSNWDYFTGTRAASFAVQRAFGVYRGDKMAHTPQTFLRLAPGQPWTRIDGFLTPTQLLHSYRQLLAAR